MTLRKALLMLSAAAITFASIASNADVEQVTALAPTAPSHGTTATIGVGPSYGLLNGVSGFGLGVDALFDVTKDRAFSLGFHTGFVRWSERGASVTAFPILASGMYRAPVAGSVHPYFGLALGVSVTNGSYGSLSATEAFFNGFARPGLEFGDWSSSTTFFVEPKLGIIESEFVFVPTLGANFRI